MTLRDKLNASLKDAMKAKEAERLSTLRLINAAIKDRDIAARGEGEEGLVSDEVVLAILGKMVKQRQESARAYDEAGRLELAEKERAERRKLIALNKLGFGFVVAGMVMGKVMAALKARYMGRMDFGRVGPLVRDRLS